MLDFLENISLDYDDIPALVAIRQKGKLSFRGLPSKKTEAFKYTPVASVLTEDMFLQSEEKCDEEHCHCHESYFDFASYEFHFCNGRLHEHFHLEDGLEASSMLDAVTAHETSKYLNQTDWANFPFAALNTAYLEQGLFLRVSKKLDKPIAFIYHNKSKGFKNIRNVIVVEKGAKAELIEVFEGQNEPYFLNIVNEIFISKNAELTHCKLQKESNSAVHIALQSVHVKSQGKFESYTLQTGSKLARNETHVFLKEEGATALVNAAYHIKGLSLIDTTTDIEHISKETTSNQLIKGVVDEAAHGVFQGKIHIAPNAVQTEGYQLHKALLLSDDAAVDVKPELEIFADDVKCSHGATSGDLNQDELFYLCSRGISEKEARQILTSAFLNEAFEGIKNESLKTLFRIS